MRPIHVWIIALMILAVSCLIAAPHSFLPISVTQTDGSSITIYASGDEFHNWLHDKDNYTIVRDDSGAYVYAAQDGENVVPTDLFVGRDTPSMRNLEPGINLGPSLIKQKYDRYEQMRDYSNGRSPHTGQFNNLVIFIKFSDSPEFVRPLSYYEHIFNADGESENSMRRYFQEASYGQLHMDSFYYPIPNGDVVVSYTDNQPRSYFQPYSPSNPNGYSGDNQRTQREQQMLVRAVNGVSSQIPSSLVIDGDNDGYVDNVCFIIQGSPDGWAELLWPHRWVLYAANAYIHGKQVWDFNFQLETSLDSSGASVLCHEMFHSLGAPDLYRYQDTTIDPVGSWDLMCSNQNPPQHMSVWMKYRYGEWIDNVPTITTSGSYTLSPVAASSTNNIYRINSWRSGEYYVLEYRKPHGIYDGNLPGRGLLVYRLNTSQSGNASGPPDELYIYRPNGTNTVNGHLGMAHFSEQVGRRELSEYTTPSGFLGDGSSGGLNLFDVGYADDTISFKVKISDIQLTSPHGGEVWFSGTNKTITWKSKSSTGTVKLEYSVDGGENWTQIATGVHNSGSYTWYNLPPMNSENAHIRVSLINSNHSDTNYYPITIINELIVPQPIYPAHNATNIPTNPRLSWQAVPGATAYYFQLAIDEDFVYNAANIDGWQNNYYQASRLRPNTQYYWRVAAVSDVGYSLFSDTQIFTTGELSELPVIPNLISPVHLTQDLSIPVTFSWTTSALAESYKLQICRSPYFETRVQEYDNIPTNQISIHELSSSTTYYWRVASKNIAGTSNFSQINRFTTEAGTDSDDPQAPVLTNELKANYPNPFNPETYIPISIKDSSQALSVKIFNLKGQSVRTLHQGLPKDNQITLFWDGKDDLGRKLPDGIYFCKMQTKDFVKTRKLLMMK